MSLPQLGERDLRLDLFRGLALWLIFLDHIPSNIVSWITIRNYGFSDATEIFVFISGYTAAFVYGRAMREHGAMVAGARILKRAWQVYVAHIFLFAIYTAEISYVAHSFENPLYSEEMGIFDFLQQPDVTLVQALLLKFKPANMDVLPLYIVLLAAFPPMLWLLLRAPIFALAGSFLLYALTWHFQWNLPAYPNGTWVFNPFAWQLLFVFGAWCALGRCRAAVIRDHVADHGRPRSAVPHLCVSCRINLVRPGPRYDDTKGAGRLDVYRQDQSTYAPNCAFSQLGGGDGPPGTPALGGTAFGLAAPCHSMRPEFPRNLLSGRVSFFRGAFRPGGSQ